MSIMNETNSVCPLLIESFPTAVSRTWQEVPWLGRSQHDKLTKQTKHLPS